MCMKRIVLSILVILMSASVSFAETVWHDATEFPLFGKITDDTQMHRDIRSEESGQMPKA